MKRLDDKYIESMLRSLVNSWYLSDSEDSPGSRLQKLKIIFPLILPELICSIIYKSKFRATLSLPVENQPMFN